MAPGKSVGMTQILFNASIRAFCYQIIRLYISRVGFSFCVLIRPAPFEWINTFPGFLTRRPSTRRLPVRENRLAGKFKATPENNI